MFRAFTEHPESVGETYFEHLESASGFAATMLAGAVACFPARHFPLRLPEERQPADRRVASADGRQPPPQPIRRAVTFLGVAEGI
jgi:hypothetical protein